MSTNTLEDNVLQVDVLKDFMNNFNNDDDYLTEGDNYIESKFNNYKREIQEEKISPPSPTNSLKYISRQSSPIVFDIPNYYYECNDCLKNKNIVKQSFWLVKCDTCLAYRKGEEIVILNYKNKKLYCCGDNCNNINHFVKCEKCKEIKIRKNMKKVLIKEKKIKIV